LDRLQTPLEHAQNGIPEIFQKVKAICYLDGARCLPPEGIGVFSAAIAADYVDAGVLLKPRSERLRTPIG
jgi:hypothetical protein